MNPIYTFYRSAAGAIPSPSLSLVAAAALAASTDFASDTGCGVHLTDILSRSHTGANPFYHQAGVGGVSPAESLEKFAKNLLNQTVENPPEAEAIISKHFWELV